MPRWGLGGGGRLAAATGLVPISGSSSRAGRGAASPCYPSGGHPSLSILSRHSKVISITPRSSQLIPSCSSGPSHPRSIFSQEPPRALLHRQGFLHTFPVFHALCARSAGVTAQAADLLARRAPRHQQLSTGEGNRIISVLCHQPSRPDHSAEWDQ